MMPLEMISQVPTKKKKTAPLSSGKGFRDLTPFLVTSGADNDEERGEDREDATRHKGDETGGTSATTERLLSRL